MRVCLVSSSFYPAIFYGGPISSTWDLSRKLADKDIKMYFLSFPTFKSPWIGDIKSIKPCNFFPTLIALIKQIKKCRYP